MIYPELIKECKAAIIPIAKGEVKIHIKISVIALNQITKKLSSIINLTYKKRGKQ